LLQSEASVGSGTPSAPHQRDAQRFRRADRHAEEVLLMKSRIGLAAVLVCLLGTPARADEDCDNVFKALEDAMGILSKSFDTSIGELKQIMSRPADDKTKVLVKNRFCSGSGEFLGTTRAVRAVAQECKRGQFAALASVDKSIREVESAIENACK
jgi:hypothetical protein